jgi:hypothetical protein
MTKRAVLHFYEEMHDKLEDKRMSGHEVLEDQHPEEPEDCGSNKRLWKVPMKDLESFKQVERVNIYLRWREGGPLLTYPLLTRKRGPYTDINCFLCHVNCFGRFG